jgi:hypothetical protein
MNDRNHARQEQHARRPGDMIKRIGAYVRARLQPPRNDPRHNDPSVLPGQADVPAGGTSGGEMRGVGGRRKR